MTDKKKTEDKNRKKATPAFFSSKNKTSAMCVAAFLLAGGLVFLVMAITGERNLRGDDIKFSYGNVLKGAFSPLEDFFTKSDKWEKNEKIARVRMHSRGAEFADESVNINDWLDAPADNTGVSSYSSGAGGAGYSKEAKTKGKRNPGEHSEYHKMEAALGSASFSGGGGTSKTSASISSFQGETVSKNAVNSGKKEISSSLKKNSEKSAKQMLQQTREELSTALTSGSAVTAKTNWGSSFDGTQTAAFNNVKNGSGGKLSAAYEEKGLVKLDEIKSGEIDNLKTDGKTSIAKASVPKMDSSNAMNRTAKDAIEDSLKDVMGSVAGTVGDGLSDKISGKSSSKKDKEKSSGKEDKDAAGETEGTMSAASVGGMPASQNEPPENIRNVMENTRTSNDHSEMMGDGNAITYEDTKVTYNQNEDGSWTVTYEGKYTMIDTKDGGKATDSGTYKDTFKIGADGKMADLVAIEQNGQTLYSEIDPPPNQLPPATITPNSGGSNYDNGLEVI